jgi:phosphatidylserine/phosphatidylglycerophosphate/cardiolipin synthase-like enzyme
MADEIRAIEPSKHQITLLPSVASTLEAIERDIARARSRAWIESFIVRDDRLGNRLLAWLSAARARGVDARLLYAVSLERLRSRSVREKLTHAALRFGMRLLESVAWLGVGSARRLSRSTRWVRRAFRPA